MTSRCVPMVRCNCISPTPGKAVWFRPSPQFRRAARRRVEGRHRIFVGTRRIACHAGRPAQPRRNPCRSAREHPAGLRTETRLHTGSLARLHRDRRRRTCGFLFARVGVLWAGVLAATTIAAVQSLAWLLFVNSHMLLDAANPSFCTSALAFFAGLSARRLEVSRAREALKASFADSLPVRAIQAIAAKPALLKLAAKPAPLRASPATSAALRRSPKLRG